MSEYRLEKSSNARAIQKRVALVRPEEPARLLDQRGEVVTVAPHLLLREIIVLEICVALLAAVSLAFDAPLEGIADPLHTPNPAKAPWYFLGLQELLHYFPPVVAGVLLPFLVVVAIGVIPYFRANQEIVSFYRDPWRKRFLALSAVTLLIVIFLIAFQVWPVLIPTVVIYAAVSLPAARIGPEKLRGAIARVPLADWIMTWFVVVTVTLIVIGTFFRGPGWSWVWPWGGGGV